MTKLIPYGRHHITKEDIQSVVEVLQSDSLTQGPKIGEFERAFAHYIGADFAVAVSNGTAALHLCATALNVRPGDKVITTPITFAATANCVRYCGGEVVFADIDPETYLLDIKRVRALLEAHPKGTFKGIIPVDFAGRAINLEAYRNLADEFDLWLIEDACHAPGGSFIDSHGTHQRCGNGRFANLAIFSFHPVKHIAAGEGGMITTNDENLYKRLLKLRTHGITKDPEDYENSPSKALGNDFSDNAHDLTYPGWYMEMQELGFNYRLTDFQAALGKSQLSRADEGLTRRREIAKRYSEALSQCSGIIRQSGVVEGHAYHLYIIEATDRLGLYNHLKQHGILCQVHYVPLTSMPYYRGSDTEFRNFPNVDRYYSACLSLPIFPTLETREQDFVISKILTYYDKAC